MIDTTELEQAAAAVERELIAQYCEKRAEMHAEYLPHNAYYKDGSLDNAATCGRRDECRNLADLIRRGAYKEGKV